MKPDLKFHYEREALIKTPQTEIYDFLDNPARMASHMSESTWMMAGSKMTTEIDKDKGQSIGSRIILRGSFLGVPIMVSEIVSERNPSDIKRWITDGPQKLIIMDQYEMGFEVNRKSGLTRFSVFINYSLPSGGAGRILGRLFAGTYAKWCINQIVNDTLKHFTKPNPVC